MLLPEAQRITDRVGQFDQISVAAEHGVTPEQLRDRIARGDAAARCRWRRASEAAQRQTNDIDERTSSFLRIALLVFAGVSLFVGAFQIFNTFSITVAQRTREFGMLRTLGASRRQILTSVGFEALALGVLGAAAGLAGGVGFAFGINELFKAVGIDLPNTGTVLDAADDHRLADRRRRRHARGGADPALRATRVTPMAALREAELQDTKQRGRVVTAVALVLGAVGLAMMLVGPVRRDRGLGHRRGPAGRRRGADPVRRLAVLAAAGAPARLGSPGGRSSACAGSPAGSRARTRCASPGRTATTAAALMIGLALVVFVTIFAAGINSSVAKTIDESFRGEIVLQNTDGFSPIPREALDVARGVDGVRHGLLDHVRHGRAAERRRTSSVAAVDPATLGQVLALDFKSGDPAASPACAPNEHDPRRDLRARQGPEGGRHAARPDPDRADRRPTGCVGNVKGELDLLGKARDRRERRPASSAGSSPTSRSRRLAPTPSPKEVQDAMEQAR